MATLREKIKEDPQVEVKKEIVRTLVDSITVITIQEEDKPLRAEVLVKYRFIKAVTRTDYPAVGAGREPTIRRVSKKAETAHKNMKPGTMARLKNISQPI